MLTLILSGCAPEINEGAVLESLARPVDRLSEVLVNGNLSDIRAAGRNVIAVYDAGVGPR